MIHQDWIPAFHHPSYLRIGGNLVFKIHNGPQFKQNCSKSDELVAKRLNRLREVVRSEGLGELLIGAGSGMKDLSDPTVWWGYPYNFTNIYGAVANDDVSFMGQVLPWANESAYVREWREKHRQAAEASGHYSHVPNVMSGWDPRPWHERRASYVFPTASEWEAELSMMARDLQNAPSFGFPLPDGSRQPAFSIYAWNEFAEGGIMAPSHGWNTTRLEAIGRVFPKDGATSRLQADHFVI